jgi:hypothetical protein
MGMFSWKCKGCGEEICEPEIALVVTDRGTTWGNYDGYGRVGMYDYGNEFGNDPVIWHKYCYEHAPVEDQLNTCPSDYAPNQGFGKPNPKFC